MKIVWGVRKISLPPSNIRTYCIVYFNTWWTREEEILQKRFFSFLVRYHNNNNNNLLLIVCFKSVAYLPKL